MSMLRTFLSVVLLFIITEVMAQTPRVTAMEPLTSYPFSVLEIKGSGFSTTPSQLQVWFGHVKGTILSSTETSIRVEVPAQARLGNVEVINLSSRRSGRSAKKYMMNFSGKQPFANSFSATLFDNPDDIFDLCACDFDGDGRTDIVGSKFRDGKTNLFLLINKSTVGANNSTIAFDKATIPLNFPTFSVTCGDLNGDGKPELIATRGGNITGNNVYIFPNTSTSGSVSFGAPVVLDLTIGDFAREVVLADMNLDGRPDIVVSNSATNLLYIFENQLTASTILASQFTRHDILAGAATLALDVADLNGDSYPEIIAGRSLSDSRLIILKNPANGSLVFGGATSVTIGGSNIINDIATADFNNDGRTDIVVADRGSNKAFVYLHESELIFKSVNANTGFPAPTAWGVDVGDMNGDGFADFVIGSRDFTNPQVNVFINSGAATPSFTATKITTLKANWFVRVGDFDGDAKPDIAVTSTNNSTSFSIDILKNKNCHQPVILNENPVSVCDGQTVELRAIPMKGVAFTWSTGSTGPTTTIGFANTGIITLTAVGEGSASVCSGVTTITVDPGSGTAPAKPTVGGPAGVCAGSVLTLTTASVAGSPVYTWSGPNNFTAETTVPSITVTSSATTAQAGNYTVRVRNGDCVSSLSDPKAISVIEPDGFTIVSSAGNTGACVGQSVTLSVNPISGYTYQWKKGTTTISGATSPTLTLSSATAGDAGSYTVLIGHAVFSCSSETAPFTLNVFAAPVASFVTSPQQICVGTQVAFDGSASTLASGVTANYAWEFGNSATGTGITTTHTYNTAQPSLTAKLTVSYAGLSACTSSATKALSVNAATPPTISVDPQVTSLCANASETATLTVPGTFTTYLWTTTSNNTGSSITIKTPGTFAVTTTDANGCPGRAEVTFTPKEGCESSVVPSVSITAPKVFSPNDDNINDFWVIGGLENYPDCMMSIFDGKGRRVYEAKGSVLEGEPWNGRGMGGPVPDGTYYYVFGCPDTKPFTGSVLIVR
jgi:gliding motility-associated-like protein